MIIIILLLLLLSLAHARMWEGYCSHRVSIFSITLLNFYIYNYYAEKNAITKLTYCACTVPAVGLCFLGCKTSLFVLEHCSREQLKTRFLHRHIVSHIAVFVSHALFCWVWF